MYMESAGAAVTTPRHLAATWSQIAMVVSAVDGSLAAWLDDEHRLGLTEYRALLLLSRADDRELRLNHLASKVGLNQSSVTRLVGRLEAKQLVFRDTCPDDGRGVYAVLSDAGMTMVETIRQPYEAKIGEILSHAREHYPQLDLTGIDDAFATVRSLLD